MKIRSVLAEFEEMKSDNVSPYTPGVKNESFAPVAILGAREYIFSENVGILGDVAAGKEQTFGTLFARTLSQIGGKLHYGHPDFLNGIFMTTRGGVSKAQKGLHLNEDIYAGMNAMLRGGRREHAVRGGTMIEGVRRAGNGPYVLETGFWYAGRTRRAS